MLVAVIEQNWIKVFMKVNLGLKIFLSWVHKSKNWTDITFKSEWNKKLFYFFREMIFFKLSSVCKYEMYRF